MYNIFVLNVSIHFIQKENVFIIVLKHFKVQKHDFIHYLPSLLHSEQPLGDSIESIKDQRNSMMERKNGMCTCKLCEYTTGKKDHI